MEARPRSDAGYWDGAAVRDEELVRWVRAGAFVAFGVLVRRYTARVHRAVRSILRDDADVDDVVQQTFLQAFVALGRFQGSCSFSTWLVRIASNEALMRLRRRWVVVDAGSHSEVAAFLGPGPEQLAADREALDLVREAVRRLPARHRELFRLRHVGFSLKQVAARLGITESAAKVRLHRARRVLRRASAGADPPRPPSAGPPNPDRHGPRVGETGVYRVSAARGV